MPTRQHFDRHETARLLERLAHEPDTTERLFGHSMVAGRSQFRSEQEPQRENVRSHLKPHPGAGAAIDVSAVAAEPPHDVEPHREAQHDEPAKRAAGEVERIPHPAETQRPAHDSPSRIQRPAPASGDPEATPQPLPLQSPPAARRRRLKMLSRLALA